MQCSARQGRSGKAGLVFELEQTENILILTEPLTSVLGNVSPMSSGYNHCQPTKFRQILKDFPC